MIRERADGGSECDVRASGLHESGSPSLRKHLGQTIIAGRKLLIACLDTAASVAVDEVVARIEAQQRVPPPFEIGEDEERHILAMMSGRVP